MERLLYSLAPDIWLTGRSRLLKGIRELAYTFFCMYLLKILLEQFLSIHIFPLKFCDVFIVKAYAILIVNREYLLDIKKKFVYNLTL